MPGATPSDFQADPKAKNKLTEEIEVWERPKDEKAADWAAG
jgi:hypothetical protein